MNAYLSFLLGKLKKMGEVIYQKERIENQFQAWYNVENKFPTFFFAKEIIHVRSFQVVYY